MYITKYRIIDNNTNKLIFKNTSTACFQEFNFASDKKDKEIGFYKDRTLEIFFPKNLNTLSDQIIIKWLRFIKSIGLKNKLYTFNYIEKTENYPESLKTNGIYNVVSLNFNNYTSKIQLKLALHLVRYLYEENLYKVIEAVYENKTNFQSIFELFQLKSFLINVTGHKVIYTGVAYEIISKLELLEIYDKWMIIKTDNHLYGNSINIFFNNQLKNKGYLHKFDITLNTKLSEYKKIIKQKI